MDEALITGDASKLSTEDLLNAGIYQAQTETNYCKTELAKIYPNSLEESNFPIRSAYMTSSSSRNIPLHVADNDGSIEVYSWLGKKASGTPYAVLGTNVFSFTNVNSQNIPLNKSLKNSTLNVFRWLLKQDANANILSQPFIVVAPNSNDRSELAAWFTANGLSHSWTVTGNTALLDSGNYDLYFADIRRDVALAKKAFAANKPVLAYNNWYEPPADALAEFDLVWDWYGEQTIGNLPSTTEQCLSASTSAQIQALMTNLQEGLPDYNYSAANCPNNVGTVSCAATQLLDSEGQSVENAFFQGARSIRDQLNALDTAGKNVFALDDGSRLLKMAVLLGDKYRETITYPMDKVGTDESTFYRALYADYAVHYAWPDNPYQQDMGDFTDAQAALNSVHTITQTVTLTPTVFDEWTSTGLYAPPGKTITVRRTDNGTNVVHLRFNMLRESTRIWNTNSYSRPRYMASPSIALKPGQTYTLSTPYGGPIYLNWDAVPTGATPFTVEFSNVLDNPLLTAFDEASISAFLNEVETTGSDWIDIKTPFAEIHTLKQHMIKAFKDQDGNNANGYTILDVQAYIDDLNNYLIKGNYAYAGFTGADLPSPNAEVQAFCSTFQLTNVAYDGATKNLCTDPVIHAKPKTQHINSDINAACGALCSGNPFDSSGPIKPLDWGESHEMGHNLQRDRLQIYDDRTGEVSNNIFPLHTQWQWTVAKGLAKHPSQTRPSNQAAFNMLQNAVNLGTPSNGSHPLWSGTGTYDNAFERLSFYMQLAYTHQSWDIYTKIYLMERIFSDAIQSDTKWAAVKDRLGFGNYSRTAAQNINGNDFMYIAASMVGVRNYSDFFEAWGIELTQAAKDQVTANNIAAQVPKRFYYVNNELPAVMPLDTYSLPLDGVATWAVPTP